MNGPMTLVRPFAYKNIILWKFPRNTLILELNKLTYQLRIVVVENIVEKKHKYI